LISGLVIGEEPNSRQSGRSVFGGLVIGELPTVQGEAITTEAVYYLALSLDIDITFWRASMIAARSPTIEAAQIQLYGTLLGPIQQGAGVPPVPPQSLVSGLVIGEEPTSEIAEPPQQVSMEELYCVALSRGVRISFWEAHLVASRSASIEEAIQRLRASSYGRLGSRVHRRRL
ncbi:MAG: hypothetical protein AAGA67_14265, partial [Cyanobacteria bacterium P01_F01_bin.153]